MKRNTLTHTLAAACLALAALPAATAQTRIAVLADTHVMAKELIVNDGTAWQEALAGERKLLDYSQPIFDQLTDNFATERPDLLLMVGDLTKDGERLSHQHVKDRLDLLRAAGVKTYVIPGNHDLGGSRAYVFDGDSRTPAETIGADDFTTLYRDHGYGDDALRDTLTLSYACQPIAGLTLIGIDSGRDGVLPEATVGWVCDRASEARSAGRQVLAMMHHPLVEHFNAEERFLSTSVVADHESVRNRMADAGIHTILTGHIHTSDIAKDYNADMTRELYDVNTGSTISYPCDYRLMTLSQDLTLLDISTRSVDHLDTDDSFTPELARNRLYESALKNALGKVGNEDMARLAASAFVVHAEGNENLSDQAKEILDTYQKAKENLLIRLLIAAADAEPTVMSMLTDTSNYDTERADQTNDRTLTILLPRPERPVVAGDADNDGLVTAADILAIVGTIAGKDTATTPDVNNDGHVNVADIVAVTDILAAEGIAAAENIAKENF